ncbi:MAG: hypothetical protein AB7T38_11235 [Nitrospirales bacterium]
MRSFDRTIEPIQEFIEKLPDNEMPEPTKKKVTEKIAAERKKGTPLDNDVWIYRFVVWFLGLAILTSLAATFYLTLEVKPMEKLPDIFLALGSAAVGALAGLLAPSPGGEK